MSSTTDTAGSSAWSRLQELSETIDAIQLKILGRDKAGLFKELVKHCQTLFQAEDVSFFVVDDASPKQLKVVEEAPGPLHPPEHPVMIPDDPTVQRVGLTGWCVAVEVPTRLHGFELRNHPAVSGNVDAREFLPAKQCHSLLAVPLIHKKKRPLGLLKVNNKLGKDGHPGDDIGFSAEDLIIANILEKKITAQLDTLRIMEALQALTEEAHKCADSGTYYDFVLRTALRLLRCERGMLALWGPEKQDIVVAAKENAPGGPGKGEPLPKPSVMRRCWDTEPEILLEDVTTAPDYHPYHPNTKSEAAVRLEWEGLRFGVLNVESDNLGHFDRLDIGTLRHLAPCIAAAHRAVAKETHFLKILRQLSTFGWSHQSILRDLLRTVLNAFGFANGHIFMPNAERTKLSCVERVPKGRKVVIPTYDLANDEKSVQKLVFLHKAHYFSPDVEQDGEFHPDGVTALDLHGPYLAIRLTAAEEAVGVLSVWGDSARADSRKPAQQDIPRLERYARIAGGVVGLSLRQRAFFEALTEVAVTLQRPVRPEEVWPMLVRLVRQAGFERVHVFRNHPERWCFEMQDVVGASGRPPFRLSTHEQGGNPYARETVRQAMISSAVIKYPIRKIGPDPTCHALGREANDPWIVIPLVSHGRLYGQITADNCTRPPGQRGIHDDSIRNLSLVGSVAAMAIAHAETVNRLSWKSLAELHTAIRHDDAELTLLRRLLVYLTDGEAFGFSRALYFEYRGEVEVFSYRTSLGSPDEARFRGVGAHATSRGIRLNLQEAAVHKDDELEAKVLGLDIPLHELGDMGSPTSRAAARPYHAGNIGEWPGWAHKLAGEINSSHLAAVPVFGTGQKIYGLFVVDRQWQDRSVNDTDLLTLPIFCQHVGVLFGQREAAKEAKEAQRGAIWKDVAQATSHRLGTANSTIETELETLARELATTADPTIKAALTGSRVAVEEIKSLVNQFKVLRDIYNRFPGQVGQSLPLEPILRERCAPASKEGIVCQVICPPDATWSTLTLAPLTQCLDNLLDNARYWCQKRKNRPPTITVVVLEPLHVSSSSAGPERSYREFHIQDNGLGVPLHDKPLLWGPQFTRRPGGTGFGLWCVHEIVRALGGTIHEVGDYPFGADFRLLLPQEPTTPAE